MKSNRLFYSIVSSVIFLKILATFFTSYPFDFASYVYQIRQFFDYNISPLFFWNKGLFLLCIFYVQYVLYTGFLYLFDLVKDNILMLHFFYKLPFLAFDILTGIYLVKIATIFDVSAARKRIIFLLWILNPIVFWVTEVHGQYVLACVFITVLSIYFALINKFNRAIISLAVAGSVYYYPLILLPFYLLFALKNEQKLRVQPILKNMALFIFIIFILFFPFLTNKTYLTDIKESLIHHSAPDAPGGVQEIYIPDYSLFKIPYYLLFNKFPSNVSAPVYFNGVSKATYLGIFIIILYIFYRISMYIFRKQKNYSPEFFINDLIIATSIFLIFISKFQIHYIVWLLPLLLLSPNRSKYIGPYFLLSVLPIFYILGRNNIGIYFLDAIPWGSINLWLAQSDYILAFNGFLSVILIITILIRTFLKHNTIDKTDYFLSIPMIALCFIFFALIIFSSAVSIISYKKNSERVVLASDSGIYNFRYTVKSKETTVINENNINIALPDSSFEYVAGTIPTVEGGFINNTSKTSPWFFYNVNGINDVAVSVTDEESVDGAYSLKLESLTQNGNGQINLGGQSNNNYILVEPNAVYYISAYIKTKTFDGWNAKFSAREVNSNNEVISGSDVRIAEINGQTDWSNVNAIFRTSNEAKYLDILMTLMPGSAYRFNNSKVYIDKINLSKKIMDSKTDTVFTYQNPRQIERIITNIHAVNNFDFIASIKQPSQKLIVKFNNCDPNRTYFTDDWSYYYFNPTCYGYGNDNNVHIFTDFLPENTDIRLNFLHKSVGTLFLAQKKNIFFLSLLGSIILNLLLLIIFLRNLIALRKL